MAEYNVDKFTYNSNTYKFVDNTSGYIKTSSTAASGGTTLSLVTTGEKYTWNNKSNLALGTTSSTAYRGDYGNTAYSHATDSSRLTTATSSGLYKIASTAQGHIASLTAISKTDITGLGIPAQDTTYSSLTAASGGTDVSLVTTGQKYTWNNKSNLAIGTTASTAAAGNHVHGNITNAGDITTTATIASGDRIVINDESASKITNSSITFGTSTTTFLRNDGTWATPAGGSGGGTSDTASYLNVPSESGYQTDDYGNLLHKRSNANDCFNLKSYGTDGTDRTTTLKMYFDSGNIESTGAFIGTNIDQTYLKLSQVSSSSTNIQIGSSDTSTQYYSTMGSQYLWMHDKTTPAHTALGSSRLYVGMDTSSSSSATAYSSLSRTELTFRASSTNHTLNATGVDKVNALGTIVQNGGTKSGLASSSTSTSLTTFSLAKGTWIVTANIHYESNSTGYRLLDISPSSTSNLSNWKSYDLTCFARASTGTTILQAASVVTITASSCSFTFSGRQNSGSSLDTTWAYKAIRII